jgi:hypothetical protein
MAAPFLSGKRVFRQATTQQPLQGDATIALVFILLAIRKKVISSLSNHWRLEVAEKATKKKINPREYTTSDVKLLKAHSKARTPVSKLTKLMKRSEGSLRQKALKLGIGLGHQR